jgi:hypothetical protein
MPPSFRDAAACLRAHEFIIDETIEYTTNGKAFGQKTAEIGKVR